MDVRDLNILDWVLWDNTPCQVTAIGCDYIETTKCGITLAESHLINPIPLTAEILEKNGFMPISKDKYVYAQVTVDLDESLVIIKSKDARMTINIAYVHQLQHAMRLCLIEKEIEI